MNYDQSLVNQTPTWLNQNEIPKNPNTAFKIDTAAEWQIMILNWKVFTSLSQDNSYGVIWNSLSGIAWWETKDSRSKSHFYSQ